MAIKPVVSIIVVNYNAGALLTRAIQNVNSYPDVEVIVVDNASRDDSLSLLSQAPFFKDVKLIKNSRNLGYGAAVNQAGKLAKGQYLYLLNPDAFLTSEALTQMLQTARDNSDYCIVAPRLENPDGTTQASCFRAQSVFNAVREFWFGTPYCYSKYIPPQKKASRVDIAVAAAWLMPKTVWQKLGGFSLKFFLYFEDLDFCDRARALGIPIIYDPRATVVHNHGVSSTTNPHTHDLFLRGATLYHGKMKKDIIDLIIRIGHKINKLR